MNGECVFVIAIGCLVVGFFVGGMTYLWISERYDSIPESDEQAERDEGFKLRAAELLYKERQIGRIKKHIFMRLNTAMDNRDHISEKFYREIQEVMR